MSLEIEDIKKWFNDIGLIKGLKKIEKQYEKDIEDEMCINYYVGGSCHNKANPKNVILDGCDRPLVYCDKCWRIR